MCGYAVALAQPSFPCLERVRMLPSARDVAGGADAMIRALDRLILPPTYVAGMNFL
jgi:hypothetical protein